MKHAWKILFIAAVLFACHGNEELPLGREESLTDNCNIPATVRDKRGLDGCGFVFELEDGTLLELEPLLYYGTPPLPSNKDYPLMGFEFVDGKKVKLEYESFPEPGACMSGKVVKITCIQEITASQED